MLAAVWGSVFISLRFACNLVPLGHFRCSGAQLCARGSWKRKYDKLSLLERPPANQRGHSHYQIITFCLDVLWRDPDFSFQDLNEIELTWILLLVLLLELEIKRPNVNNWLHSTKVNFLIASLLLLGLWCEQTCAGFNLIMCSSGFI